MTELYIGLMSGTALDGADAVLADFSGPRVRVLGSASLAFPASLRAALLALNDSGPDELHRAALAANALSLHYASVSQLVLARSGVAATQIVAIGAHGQTVRHRPGLFDGLGYTWQLNQPALLAERTGIDVVADFRSRDIAAGGQGAPLVPRFHQAIFGPFAGLSGVLNIGGMANLTVLDADAPQTLLGFDCGPGNALMDSWCHTHTGAPYDADGAWAAQGRVHEALLARLLDEPYFKLIGPKSTGRDLFNPQWLHAQLARFAPLAAVDVQATLTELTAHAAAHSVAAAAPGCERLIVCGGGALNGFLMRRLQSLLGDCLVQDSAHFGMPPMQVEACAFAWLARQCIRRESGNWPAVTGAQGTRVLGALYPR